MTDVENPYQSPLVAGAAFERVGPSGWRFLPMAVAIIAGFFYLLYWGVGCVAMSVNFPLEEALAPVGLLTVFCGLPGFGMLTGAWLWFRVRYMWATVLCGRCMLPLLLMVGVLLLALLA